MSLQLLAFNYHVDCRKTNIRGLCAEEVEKYSVKLCGSLNVPIDGFCEEQIANRSLDGM